MHKFLLFILATFLFALPASAQKQLKPVRTALKAKNYAEALKQVEALENDSTAKLLPALYNCGVEANVALNDAENEKIYLHQAYDTVKFFTTTRAIVDYALRATAAERKAEGTLSKKSLRTASELVARYYPNLSAAGRFFFARQKYAEAMPHFALYLALPNVPEGERVKQAAVSATYQTNAYLYLRSAFKAERYDEVYRYKDIALADTSSARCITLETLALTAEAQSDTAALRSYLTTGLEAYPAHSFFFTRLADYYTARGNDAEVLRLADAQLCTDTANVYALVARTLVLMRSARYEEAIVSAQRCLRVDTAQTEMYYCLGAAHAALAEALSLPDNINSRAYRRALDQQKAIYREAMPPLERYRALAPNQRDRWAPLLYRIYLALNEGKKFEEISKVMSSKK